MSVREIMERNQRVIVLDGIEYRCHKISTQLMISALGPAGLLPVMAGLQEGDEKRQGDIEEGAVVMRLVLREAMISPRLGEHDDLDADVVSLYTMADHVPRLYSALMADEGKSIANFPESCAEKTGE